MAVDYNNIKWSNLIIPDENNGFGRIGITIENNDQSLTNENTQAVLNLSIWFKAENVINSTKHILKINGEKKECLPIHIDEDMLNRSCEPALIYFENMVIKKLISKQDLRFDIELLNVNGFYDKFQITTADFKWFENENGLVVAPLKKYNIKFYDANGKLADNLKKYKYQDKPFYLYSADYLKLPELQREGYRLIKLKGIKETKVSNDNIYNEYIFSLDKHEDELVLIDEDSKEPYSPNDSFTFNPIYEKIIHNITYCGNGGVTDLGDIEITKSEKDLAPEFTREGYEFIGWSFSSGKGAEIIYDFNNLTKDIIVYAIWQKKIKISYQVNPLDIDNLKVININDFTSLESLENEIVQISNIIPQAKDTYKFNCWTFEENENIKTVYPGQTIISNLDKISLKAEWKEEKYTVTYYKSFSDDGDKSIIKEKNFYFNKGIVEEQTFQEETFSKWHILDKQHGYIYKAGDILPNKNIELYSVEEIELKFNYYERGKLAFSDVLYAYNAKKGEEGKKLFLFFPRKELISSYSEGENTYYFHNWKYYVDEKGKVIEYFYPDIYYNIDISLKKTFDLNAEYRNTFLNRNNFIIEANKDKISFIAEKFVEDKDLIPQFEDNGLYYKFFDKNSIRSKEFIESNEDACFIYNLGNEIEGTLHFHNFKEQNLQTKNFNLIIDGKSLFHSKNKEEDDDDLFLSMHL